MEGVFFSCDGPPAALVWLITARNPRARIRGWVLAGVDG